ncbi:heme-binding protein [Aeromicrobium camelliae]|uniref:Heme-binding protein n=1 Tax=Aeromicrobium camelliae TaxID=1538144 RepID=A0A3N6WKX9_9ACTN|nr:heme-binding protein [Aeromicrobium camelliae]RQN02328.1 heme-binding protein [Aeromicrobium camelliae]
MTDLTTRSHRTLDLAGAELLLDAASDEAIRNDVTQCFAVTDPSGHLIAFRRMDGAGLVSIDTAIGKARTAAHLGKASREFEELIDDGKPAMLSTPGLVPLRGGLPVIVAGEVVGALGVSGATGDIDERIAAAAITRAGAATS